MRVPGSRASKPRVTAGSGAATTVPGPASIRSSPTVNAARPVTTMYASCWPVSVSSCEMPKSSSGSHTTALIPNAFTLSAPFSCCHRPYGVAVIG